MTIDRLGSPRLSLGERAHGEGALAGLEVVAEGQGLGDGHRHGLRVLERLHEGLSGRAEVQNCRTTRVGDTAPNSIQHDTRKGKRGMLAFLRRKRPHQPGP